MRRRRQRVPPALSAWSRLDASLVGVSVAYALVMLLGPLSLPTATTLSYLVSCATVLAAATVMAVRARSAHGRLRRARASITACLVTVTVAGLLAAWVRAPAAGPPPPSVADAVYFLFLPLCVGGLLSYPVDPDSEGSWGKVVLDGLVAGTALWFVVWTVLLQPTGIAALPTATLLTSLAYPVSDVVVIAVAAGMCTRVAAACRSELGLAAAGLSLYAASDIAFTVLQAQESYDPRSWVAVLSQAGLLLVLLAALRAGRPSSAGRWLAALGALPYVAGAAAVAAAAWAGAAHGGLDGLETLTACVFAAALLAQQVVAHRDRGAALARARESRVLFRSLVVGSSDLITLHTAGGRPRYASPAVERLTGLSPEELATTRLADLVHPDDLEAVGATRSRVLADPDQPHQVLVRLRAADGSWRWCETLVSNRLHEPDVRGLVCNTRDVHESHLLQQRLRHDATHDALTGLPNRVAALEHLRRAHAPGPGGTPVVALVDLDGFKAVNDSYGHLDGDLLLVEVAGRIRSCTPAHDLVARLGGDEFVLVLSDAGTADRVGREVLEALRRPVAVGGRSLVVRASIGLAPLDGTPETALRDADLAMYAAKASGRDQVAWFRPDMHEHASACAAIPTELQHALEHGQLDVHYQPIVDLADGSLAGCEALLRWQREDGSHVPPDVFVPLAEQTGLMEAVDAWVLDRACRDLVTWRARGTAVPQVSVNVSRRQLTRALPDLVGTLLARHGLEGADLCLEITESAVAPDPVLADEVLRAVRGTGVRVALDDFGTGQSSLSQLADLPVDVVKIDKSFVARARADDGRLLLRSVLSMCRALGLRVVVEGVEDAASVTWLRADGFDLAQGYALGRPAPAGALVGHPGGLAPPVGPRETSPV